MKERCLKAEPCAINKHSGPILGESKHPTSCPSHFHIWHVELVLCLFHSTEPHSKAYRPEEGTLSSFFQFAWQRILCDWETCILLNTESGKSESLLALSCNQFSECLCWAAKEWTEQGLFPWREPLKAQAKRNLKHCGGWGVVALEQLERLCIFHPLSLKRNTLQEGYSLCLANCHISSSWYSE